jgi:hypothetical protein
MVLPRLEAVVANSPWATDPLRGACINRLFHNDVRVGMKLSQLAQLLDNPRWIADREIIAYFDGSDRYCCLMGYIPVELRAGNTVFIFHGLPTQEGGKESVWLRIDGTVNWEAFIRILRGGAISPQDDALIAEVGYSPAFVF